MQYDCAKEILDGVASSSVPGKAAFLQTWQDIMTGPSPVLKVPLLPSWEEVNLFFPVTAQQIPSAEIAVKSPAGLDGFSVSLLKSVPALLLRVLVNLLLHVRRVPAALRDARTTFIPKVPKAAEPSQFRPITVASVLQRLMHRILAKRAMEAIPLNYRQRAFQPVDGCTENIWLLSTALNEARTRRRPLHMASVDLTKAFDRVTTDATLRGARRAGLSGEFIGYLRELYTTSRTLMQFQGESLRVKPTTGVWQGDPLLPILFNLVLDEYLSSLDPDISFVSGDLRLDTMAFADDLIVFASTPAGLQGRLDALVEFFDQRGLKVNVKKSFTLSLQPRRDKKVKVMCDQAFNIGGTPLPASKVATPWRYLGVTFTPRV